MFTDFCNEDPFYKKATYFPQELFGYTGNFYFNDMASVCGISSGRDPPWL